MKYSYTKGLGPRPNDRKGTTTTVKKQVVKTKPKKK